MNYGQRPMAMASGPKMDPSMNRTLPGGYGGLIPHPMVGMAPPTSVPSPTQPQFPVAAGGVGGAAGDMQPGMGAGRPLVPPGQMPPQSNSMDPVNARAMLAALMGSRQVKNIQRPMGGAGGMY